MAGTRRRGLTTRLAGIAVGALACLMAASTPAAGEAATATTPEARITQLEQTIRQLSAEVRELRDQSDEARQARADQAELLQAVREDVRKRESTRRLDPNGWLSRFHLGGYGEMHANFGEGDAADQFDLHRLVLYLGYDFADWIRFHSEIELEHAFASSDSGGEVSVEQAYVDFLAWPALNFRLGRVLTPLGIVNAKHEPPTFNGVERPSFAKYIIPTTWSSDGVGIFGSPASWLQYELYVVGGLDGSELSAKSGIRDGRIKERPSLHEPAVTGRLDFFPLAGREAAFGQQLRLGVSGYCGGLDNGNKGKDPGLDGRILIYSADLEYTIGKLDVRGAIAHEVIDGAREIGNGTASEIFGWYLEGGYHIWPEAWKKGKFRESDAVAFVRFDWIDTQHRMPDGIARNPAGRRREWTLGLNFYLTPNFVLKADYQIRDDDSGEGLANLLNIGAGWQF
jgi:hypothetical protein